MTTMTKLFTEQELFELFKSSTIKVAKDSDDDEEAMLITLIGAKIASQVQQELLDMKKGAE